MEDDRDLLGKADALLRRHVPPRADAGEGADIPVLTELITPPAAPATPAAPGPAVHEDELTRKLVAEVVNTVQSRLAQDLERRATVR